MVAEMKNLNRRSGREEWKKKNLPQSGINRWRDGNLEKRWGKITSNLEKDLNTPKIVPLEIK